MDRIERSLSSCDVASIKMKYSTLLILAGFFSLLVSCDKKPSALTAAIADDGTVVLAKQYYLPPVGTTVTKEMNGVMSHANLTVKARRR